MHWPFYDKYAHDQPPCCQEPDQPLCCLAADQQLCCPAADQDSKELEKLP